MPHAINADGISKKYGELLAVDHISFRVRQGDTFSILGENGAGKTTTMRLIACRSPLTDGTLRVSGLDVRSEERRIRAMLGIVPQENNLDPDLNVRENLLVYARYFRIDPDTARRRSAELLDFVGLGQKTDAKVDTLSGGMKRRLIIARALIHEPRILLLDEPTTGLDPSVRQEIWEKLEELRESRNLTVLLSTHYMDEAEKLSRELIIMNRGRIVTGGEPSEIISRMVKRFALEVRSENAPAEVVTGPEILFRRRGRVGLFFADSTEELSPLLERFGSERVILRPSNLEDAFLELIV